jgi:LytS/YehU family sensor histidine kinase
VVDFGPNILAWLLPEEYMRYTPRPEAVGFFMALMNTFKGGLVSSALAVSLKAMKSWREREMRNLELQREKADAQLQLLTAQIHPHFLFNTINNIYSQTQTESPKGSEMIMELSDLLRYILYEGRKAQVPLDRELQMLVDYVNLEKIRYGNSLEVHLDLPERTNDLWIAPLMLLPFIENCFKHGASRQLHRPWISLTIEITDDTMIMNLSNGRSGDPEKKKEGGIGIRNVRNRLGLLYPNAHQLHIEDKPDVFAVKLEMKLSKGTELHQSKKERNAVEEAIYAE